MRQVLNKTTRGGQHTRNTQPIRRCSKCGYDLPIYQFKNRGHGDNNVCLSCANSKGTGPRARASIRYDSVTRYEFRHYDPPLTMELKDTLDDYVRRMIDSGSYASLNANHRLLRKLGEERATDALFVYADTAREWCVVTHGKGNGSHYHFMGYRGEEEPEYRYIDPSDFKLIDRYIAARKKPVVVNTGVVDRAGITLVTPEQKRWLLLRSYFGLRPQHKILWRGAVEGKAYWNRKFDTYLVGEPKDEVPPDQEGYSIAVRLFDEAIRGAA
jgi:hypothetical protein